MPQRDETPTNTLETWGVVTGSRVWIGGNNTDARREVELLVGNADRPPTGELDRAFITPLGHDEVVYFARKLRSRMSVQGVVWVVYPKRGSARELEYTGDVDELGIGLFQLGYSETARCNFTSDYGSTGFQLDPSQMVI